MSKKRVNLGNKTLDRGIIRVIGKLERIGEEEKKEERRKHTGGRRKLDFLRVRRVSKRILDSRKAKRDVSKIGE